MAVDATPKDEIEAAAKGGVSPSVQFNRVGKIAILAIFREATGECTRLSP